MKKICFAILFLTVNLLSYGQKAKQKKADNLFTNKAYVEAAALYETIEKSKSVLQNLADAYYYNSEMAKAKTYYDQLYKKYPDGLSPEVLFRYAHTLKANNDYENGDKIMSLYLGREVDTKKLIETLQNIIPYNYELTILKGQSATDNFGMTYFGDKVVFASVRNNDNDTYKWNNKPYLDVFEASLTPENSLENIKPFPEEINTGNHESNATFTKDGKTMYFSRTSDKRIKIDDQKIATVKIYKADRTDTGWTNIEALPFTSQLYSTQHPVLNNDNTRLYFSSNMPGSLGSFDIYYVEIKDGVFGNPINLGSTINTIHREQFPFIAGNSELYFSSDGHDGLGGLDVFKSSFIEGSYSTPQNLGNTLNSTMDDFSYVLNETTNTGFLSSNRSATDQLYTFIRTENKRTYIVEGSVRDKNTKELLPNSLVTLYNYNGDVVAQMTVGDDAQYSFEIKPNSTYQIEGSKEFYIPSSQVFTTNEEGKINFNIELEIESYDDAEEIIVTKEDGNIYIELENIYFDLDKWAIKPQAARRLDVLVALLKKYPKMEVTLNAHTDSRSSEEYNLKLSDNRAKSTLSYMVANGISASRLTSRGFGESQPLVKCGDNCTDDEHAINRRVEFIIVR